MPASRGNLISRLSGTSEYQAAWLLDGSDDEGEVLSDGEEAEGDEDEAAGEAMEQDEDEEPFELGDLVDDDDGAGMGVLMKFDPPHFTLHV